MGGIMGQIPKKQVDDVMADVEALIERTAQRCFRIGFLAAANCWRSTHVPAAVENQLRERYERLFGKQWHDDS
jgi:hypothetical protein